MSTTSSNDGMEFKLKCVSRIRFSPNIPAPSDEVFPTYHSPDDDDDEATPQRNSRVGPKR